VILIVNLVFNISLSGQILFLKPAKHMTVHETRSSFLHVKFILTTNSRRFGCKKCGEYSIATKAQV